MGWFLKPKSFKDKAELQASIDAYFSEIKTEGRPATMSGLAVALGTNRTTLLRVFNGQGYSKDFSAIIAAAKARIERDTEERFAAGAMPAGTGKFLLSNNFRRRKGEDDPFDWEDRSAQDVTQKGATTIVVQSGIEAAPGSQVKRGPAPSRKAENERPD
jgi:hypothetical protein